MAQPVMLVGSVVVTFPATYQGYLLRLQAVAPGQFVGYVGQVYASPVYPTALAALADVLRWCDQQGRTRGNVR